MESQPRPHRKDAVLNRAYGLGVRHEGSFEFALDQERPRRITEVGQTFLSVRVNVSFGSN